MVVLYYITVEHTYISETVHFRMTVCRESQAVKSGERGGPRETRETAQPENNADRRNILAGKRASRDAKQDTNRLVDFQVSQIESVRRRSAENHPRPPTT